MPSKLQLYSQMADDAARQVAGSYRSWTGFLETAARLYKYPFNEQLMIYAQRPDAVACAEYDFWNDRMRRYVRRGSKGIALIDTSGDNPRLRYVFDVSDTGGRENSIPVWRWHYREEYADTVSAALERAYDVSGENGLATQLEQVASRLAGEYWDANARDIIDIIDDSFLEEYDDFNIGAAFRNAATVSITYSLLSRCELEPGDYFEHEDFLSVFDFNTPATVCALGTAVSEINQQVLREIEATIRNYERARRAERMESHERTDLHEERGLSDSRPEPDGAAANAPGQVRQDAEELSEGAAPGALEPDAPVRDTLSPSEGDRRDGEPEAGAAHAGADEAERRDGGAEGQRPDEVDGPDEQPEGTGRGNDPYGAGVQLSLFPTEAEQIAQIEQAESFDEKPFAFSFADEDIDNLLRFGSNADNARMVIAAEFSKDKPMPEKAAFLRRTYRGGYGLNTGSGKLAVWYADDGLHLSNGPAARYSRTAQVISWEDAAARIDAMLTDGSFMTNVELAETPGFERSQLAQSMWYLFHDMSEQARNAGYLPSMAELSGGGYPDEIARLSERLENEDFRNGLTAEFESFTEAYSQDRELLRFHYHKPDEMLRALQDLSLPRRELSASMATLPEISAFITEDEIDAAISSGSSFAGGKQRIYDFFLAPHTTKEKADFLKKEYGTGGRSHALSGSSGSEESHEARGERFRKANCAPVELSWQKVAKRIEALISDGHYLTPEEQSAYDAILEARAEPETTVEDYLPYNDVKASYPDNIVLYQVGDFFEIYGEDARTASDLLGITLTSKTLPDIGRVAMCGFPVSEQERYIEDLRDRYDVTVSALDEGTPSSRRTYTILSIDHEAAQAVDAHEAEFGADGWRAFGGRGPLEPQNEGVDGLGIPEGDVTSENGVGTPVSERRIEEISIDEALRTWNGSFESKQAVVRYMEEHERERSTAAWLSAEYGSAENEPLHISIAGTNQETTLSWPKVQRRIAQLIHEDRFFTPIEVLRLSEIAAEEMQSEQNEPEAASSVDEMLAYAEQAAAQDAVEPYERFSLIETETGYAIWDDLNDGYYVDEEGVTEEFTSEWQAESYLEEIRKAVSERETAEWLAVEQAKLPPLEYAPDDHFIIFGPDGNSTTEFVLTEITDDDVFYAFADEDGEDPVSISREEFERNLRSGHIREHHPEPAQTPTQEAFPYQIGDTVYLEDGKPFIIENIGTFDIQLRDPSLAYPIFRSESKESFARLMERFPQPQEAVTETVAVYPAEENNLPYDIVVERLRFDEPEPPAGNFRITDDHLGEGGPKAKFRANMDAINTLKQIEFDGRSATPEEQEILSRYVGWGGLADAFDETKPNWSDEFQELYASLSPEEYAAARASVLNAHYTSPAVIRAIYEAVGNMGFTTGNILEPSMGVGNFFGLLPQEMAASRLYGVELDSITGRIAKQLYPDADITVAGFETTNRRDFYDLAIGNVPFGQYQVNDRAYNKLGFSIHDYFFAKTLDQVRPGGVIAFVTSRYTMDKQSPEVRKYIAQRAELLGAIRLPNNAFRANAGTDVVSDIIFLQKRDRPIEIEPEWVHLGTNEDGFAINSYFVEHPEMMLGRPSAESTQYGREDFTLDPIEGLELADQLHDAIKYIRGTYTEAELPDLGEGEEIDTSIPADPDVKNYSYTLVDGQVYYRENSRMVRPELNATATERVKGMIGLRDCVHTLIEQQMDASVPDATIRRTQEELNDLYDSFSSRFGLVNSRGNALAFADDSSYYLLCSLEVLDENGELERKADMFTRRTIKPHEVVTSVDTASEALALSISEKAGVDMEYMSELTGKSEEELADELRGVIFRLPAPVDENGRPVYQTADEYLSGNVREKLRTAERAAASFPETFNSNVEALRAAQPKDLDASEIDIRLGATWVDKSYIQQFMEETFHVPFYLRHSIEVNFSAFTAEWNIQGKNQCSYSDVNAYVTYGTQRANAYRILEDTLNLRDVRIYDTIEDPDGKERRVLNSKETTLAQQKQQAIKDAFRDWVWKDPERRRDLVQRYNELFNSNRPREYDGRHINFSGMNPEIVLREHQRGAVAHILYGGNTLLAHEVGAGKTFEMVAAAMESKRLGLCQKSLFVVPNHLTEQWASEFLRLYPSANILVATRKDFEARNRKKFCGRIATGDYDAVIIGHSQFERIPVSKERQERLLQEQIDEIEEGIAELKYSRAERFTIKQMEKTKKSLETRLRKLQETDRKDDVVTFEQLGVDRLYVDEAHAFKNLFLYTKMRNVAGLSNSDAQKSSDMLLKCRYIDEITDSKGVVFATGTPVSNSMTELYTMMRYLQHDTIQRKGLSHFDCWASTFGETITAIELAPEGTGYRARTRFARFYNLPELMNLFKEAADIKTSDQLDLPTPTAIYHNVVAQPTEIQKEMVQQLSERASRVHAGNVDPSQDNMLKITSDGRKLGLDQRVINPDLPDDPSSKVNMCVDNIVRIYKDGDKDKLTQLVFCDLSTPKGRTAQARVAKADGTINGAELHAVTAMVDKELPDAVPEFTIYEDIRSKLVAAGIPREQIAFIHDANTEVRKKELFSKVRTGQVRVLMGSTFKMGAGMNVQDRLIALHDLDAPWRPGDLEQRSGRIIRQGNMNPEVHIYRYVTEATFDAYLWQTLENKQKFISQIMTSKSPVRSCEDIDEAALSYAEIKALCAGDERIKEKMDLDIDVARLKLMKANHQSQQYRLEDDLLKTFPEQVERCKGYIAGFEVDLKTLAEHPHPKDGFAGMTIRGDALTDKENAGAALLDALKEAKGFEPVPIGSYRGFQMSLTLENFGKDYVLTLKGQMTHRVDLGKDARGNLTRIDNALNAIQNRLESTRSQLENTYAQIENAKAELGKPFPQEEELQTKSARLTELNIALNIDDRTPIEQIADSADMDVSVTTKRERPSVLAKLNRPLECSTDAPAKARSREEAL